MGIGRTLKHLLTPAWAVRFAFSRGTLDAIQAAVARSERSHCGEIRFSVEGGLDLHHLVRDTPIRARALEVFSQLRVWDTAERSGVLIYVQLIDRRIEIVADRGIAAKVPQEQWNAICRALESAYASRRFESGTLEALTSVTRLLSEHFPAVPEGNPNELPDRPVLL